MATGQPVPLIRGRTAERGVVLLLLLVAAGVLLKALLPDDTARYLGPAFASIGVLVVFTMLLQRRAGDDVFGELGFLYVALIVAYTALPAVAFMGTQLKVLADLLPEPSQLSRHLWRHVLFEAGVAAGYLAWRGRETSQVRLVPAGTRNDGRTVWFVALAIAASWAVEVLLSAPVSNYYESYTRYEHLGWLPHKLVSLSVRLALGLYSVLLVFLFRNYRRYRVAIPFVVLTLAVYELVHSYGARIQVLMILLQAACLYHYSVRRITLKQGLAVFLALGALFSAMEVARENSFNIADARSVVAAEGLRPATEFGSVFYPGYHLYLERAQGSLPPREWPMFFSDIVALFTFGDFTRWNPMFWYWRNYYPEASVPPFTMGPIAESALWGGELDLLVRGLINGVFFAFIMRWFLKHRGKWWGVTIYTYCFGAAILTLKYTVFLDLTLIEKTLVPTLILVAAARALRTSDQLVDARSS